MSPESQVAQREQETNGELQLNQQQERSPAAAAPAADEPVRLISMTTWVASMYSEADAPCLNTVRRWVRNKNIQPAPQKQGRAYFFHPSARYVAGQAAE